MTYQTSRWPRLAAWLLVAGAVMAFTGCETPGIVQTAPNAYTLTVQEKSGMFASDKADLKRRAMGQAMDFADSKGKVALPIDLQQHEYGIFGDWVRVEYQFKLVDKDDPRAHPKQPDPDAAPPPAKQPTATPPPGPVPAPTAGPHPATRTKQDLYNDLMKLDDLRKKGIITQAEFETEKKKLLDNSK